MSTLPEATGNPSKGRIMSSIQPMTPADAYFWQHRKEARTMKQWLERNQKPEQKETRQ